MDVLALKLVAKKHGVGQTVTGVEVQNRMYKHLSPELAKRADKLISDLRDFGRDYFKYVCEKEPEILLYLRLTADEKLEESEYTSVSMRVDEGFNNMMDEKIERMINNG